MSLSRQGGHGQWADALPQLTSDVDLQKMLADEKMRSEAHRTNYQTLKREHAGLQNEYMELQCEMKATVEETKLMQEKYQHLLAQKQNELTSKGAELDQLKELSVNPQRLDMLRVQVTEDLHKSFRAKFEKLEEECDRFRAENNKLKYEYSFLKAEYEHEKAEHLRVIEEINLRHESEVCNLRKERETLLVKSANPDVDCDKLRTLQRENSQLQTKTKCLLAELEEIRAQREKIGTQSECATRLQSKQIAEHQAQVKALETEKNTLKFQYESLQKEVLTTADLQNQLTVRIHDLEKENLMLKNKIEESLHKGKVDITNLRMEMMKERGELERQRDQLKNTVDDQTTQIDILKHSVERHQMAVTDKERENLRRVQAAREEEWAKMHNLETEKMELEAKLQQLERKKIDEETRQHSEREKLEERLNTIKEAKDIAEKEALVLRTKVTHQESLISQLDRERRENSELKNRLHRLETTYKSYVNSEQELGEMNNRLKNDVEDLKDRLHAAKEEIHKNVAEAEKMFAKQKSAVAEEKLNYERREDELENQLSDSQKKLELIMETNRKKKKKITRIVCRLKDKLQLYAARIEELKIERDSLKKNVSPTQHVQLKKKLEDLISKHREFRSILLTGADTKVSIGDLTFACPECPDLPLCGPHSGSFVDLANEHEKELLNIKERLDCLSSNQAKQMEELKGGCNSCQNSPTKTFSPACSDMNLAYSDDGLDIEPEKELLEALNL